VNRDEFAALAVSYLGAVSAYARRLVRGSADADDLVQDTYARAFQRWQSLRDPAACRAWLFQIARNLHIDRGRQARARSELHAVGTSDTNEGRDAALPAEAVERIEARELEVALKRLPAEQREAVLLCDLWGFRYVEIADIMSCSLGTVQSRVSRGRFAVTQFLTQAHSSEIRRTKR
jgi:RNA polymerase sigma-70 factor (ECF subfamily)